MGVNFGSIAKNSLDVSGSVVVGTSLAGKIVAPSNSTMVQSQMGWYHSTESVYGCKRLNDRW